MTRAEQELEEMRRLGMTVVECPQLHRKAASLPEGLVALGPTETTAECHAVLCHEKWHYKLNAFYRPGHTDELRRAEARVNRAVILEQVPKRCLSELLRHGLRVDEVAEMLELPEAVIWAAWRCYREEDAHFCR